MTNKRIQVLRGLAIIAVVLIHTCNDGMWQVVCRPFINYAVGLFLFLSGYLTQIDRSDWGSMCKKRITRVLIPYIVWTILYTIPAFSCKTLLYNLITTRAAATLYYIFVYIQFTVFTPLIGRMAKGKAKWAGWLISPVSVIVFKYYWLLTGESLDNHVSIIWGLSCLGWFTFYYLGLLLGNGLIKNVLSRRAVIILLIISLPLQMMEGYGWFLLGDNNCGSQLKLTSYLTTSLFLILSYYYLVDERIMKNPKILLLFGDYSFGIYLCHIMVINALKHIPLFMSIPYPSTSIIVLLFSFLFVFVGRKLCGEKISKCFGFV